MNTLTRIKKRLRLSFIRAELFRYGWPQGKHFSLSWNFWLSIASLVMGDKAIKPRLDSPVRGNCEARTRDRGAALVEAELPEKERPDIGITGDGSARDGAAPMSRLLLSAQEDRFPGHVCG